MTRASRTSEFTRLPPANAPRASIGARFFCMRYGPGWVTRGYTYQAWIALPDIESDPEFDSIAWIYVRPTAGRDGVEATKAEHWLSPDTLPLTRLRFLPPLHSNRSST